MPLQIPGKSIRPPDSAAGSICPHCGKKFIFPKLIVNPRTKKTTLVCPYCGKRLV
jgi:predicted RNA-binding Zn-ribbon protein involved in translation (DUF1610 family)